MWLERFIIVIVSLTRDFLNSSFGQYYPTQFDWAIFIGTLGFFAACMFLFLRVLPAVSIFELETLLPGAEVQGKHQAEVHQWKKPAPPASSRHSATRMTRFPPPRRRTGRGLSP